MVTVENKQCTFTDADKVLNHEPFADLFFHCFLFVFLLCQLSDGSFFPLYQVNAVTDKSTCRVQTNFLSIHFVPAPFIGSGMSNLSRQRSPNDSFLRWNCLIVIIVVLSALKLFSHFIHRKITHDANKQAYTYLYRAAAAAEKLFTSLNLISRIDAI